jgi:aryl-alcohol dehydrogenase-like predicted oxidoreductase
MEDSIRIALGTVQFGMDYGISNPAGKVHPDEVGRILEYAQESKIDVLDTAQAYGDCERVLGEFDLSGFRVISKIIGEGHVEDTLTKLRLSSIDGLMFHRQEEVNDESWSRFEKAKAQKLVKKIGVSVYSPSMLEILIMRYPVDIVQIPMNILDQRFLSLLPMLKQRRIEVHTRSAFLQGLLLMEADRVNSYFNPIADILSSIPTPRLAHALHFLKQQAGVDAMVVGVTKERELREIVEQYKMGLPDFNYAKYRIDEEKFINPSFWRLNDENVEHS